MLNQLVRSIEDLFWATAHNYRQRWVEQSLVDNWDLLNQISDLVILISPQGNILYINGAAGRLGYTPDELRGQPLGMLKPDPEYGNLRRYAVRLMKGEARGFQCSLKAKNGRVYHYEGKEARRLQSGSSDPLLLILREIAPSKAVQETSAAGAAGRKEGALTPDRGRSWEEEMEVMHDPVFVNMVAATAHEIGNALTTIQGYAQLCAKYCQLQCVSMICRTILDEARAINSITADCLLLSQPLACNPVALPVDALVQQALPDLQAIAGNKLELTLKKLASPVVKSDPAFFKDILQAVVLNSVQAAGRHGRAVIEVGTAGSRAYTMVTDNGPGIPAALREEIFKPFFTTRDKGMGLGLTIARRKARAMGGDLVCRSRGAQTSFILTLPLANKIYFPDFDAAAGYKTGLQ